MTTVVFVHGTGVRGTHYNAQFERVAGNLGRIRPDVRVMPCLWGDVFGATLSAGGMSVPDYAVTRRGNDELAAEREWEVSRWVLLEADPLHELRMLAAISIARVSTTRVSVSAVFERGVNSAADSAGGSTAAETAELAARVVAYPALADALAQLGLRDAFAAAVPRVLAASPTNDALHAASTAEVVPVLARAFVAEALRCTADEESGPVPVLRADRERLCRIGAEAMGGTDLGPFTSLARTAAMLAWRWPGSGMVDRRRGAITDGVSPGAGDILLYLSRGERVRRFIAECCEAADPPVVLVGHSLGGIAAVDLLVMHELPSVRHLVTVGSQAPYLYELGALPSLAFGEPLPATVPPWTNIYDPRDLLAYVGGAVFPGRVTDVAVPGGNPFPAAHGDYFANPAFYTRLAEVLP